MTGPAARQGGSIARRRRRGGHDINISGSRVFMEFKETEYVSVSGNGDKGALIVGEQVLNGERLQVILPHIRNLRLEIIKFCVEGETGSVGIPTGVGKGAVTVGGELPTGLTYNDQLSISHCNYNN